MIVNSSLNYVAAAVDQLPRFAHALRHQSDDVGAQLIEWAVRQITRAERFTLPADGTLFDDVKRGLAGVPLHLPFPAIVVEYRSTGTRLGDYGVAHVPKRVILACDLEYVRAHPPASSVPDFDGIFITSCVEYEKSWVIEPIALCMPRRWDEHTSDMHAVNGAIPIRGMPLPMVPSVVSEVLRAFGDRAGMENLLHDIGTEASVVMELCEALTCSNVAITNQPGASDRVNARRIKDGKLPLLSTKVLTLEVPLQRHVSSRTGGSHTRPREHLRRGHIRRLDDSRRVWVNSTVVNVGYEGGAVAKSYHLTLRS